MAIEAYPDLCPLRGASELTNTGQSAYRAASVVGVGCRAVGETSGHQRIGNCGNADGGAGVRWRGTGSAQVVAGYGTGATSSAFSHVAGAPSLFRGSMTDLCLVVQASAVAQPSRVTGRVVVATGESR